MITCRDVEARASAYLDGDLGWLRRRQVELHLLVCDMCRTYLAQLRLIVATVRRRGATVLAPEPVPAGFVEKLITDRGSLPP
jgi:anti-sigma factor RsiW